MIRIFVGSVARYATVEPVMEYCLRSNTKADVEVTFLRPERFGCQPTGCTGFTNMRYAIPEICDHKGFAIYLDVDQLVIGDIEELYSYRRGRAWSRLKDGGDEVSVIDCSAVRLPAKDKLHHHNKNNLRSHIHAVNAIPLEWNCEDCVPPGAKLVHYTGLRYQPFFDECDPHPDQAAVNLWNHWKQKYERQKDQQEKAA